MASQTGPPAKLYLRVKQIKERTGISIATLYRWLNPHFSHKGALGI
jgi:predicted DNA-binding transcriptional regulator AlpA